jgi:lipopolysaccharide export LptBFGC system permease protein LptF
MCVAAGGSVNYWRLTVIMGRSAAPAFGWIFLGAGAIALVQGAVLPLVGGAVVLRPGAWLSVVLLSPLAALWILAPMISVGGSVAGLARWHQDGAWTGLQASGTRGGQLAPAVLLVGLLGALLTWGGTQWCGPYARGRIQEIVHNPAAMVLVPKSESRVGDWVFSVRGVDGGWTTDLFFASPDGVGTATRARLVMQQGSPALELLDGVWLASGPVPVRVAFRRWIRPLAPGRRVELDELFTSQVLHRAAATHAQGRDDSYERAVAYKRWLHPLAMLLFPLAVLPLGVRRHPMVWVGASGIGYLVAVRIGDHLSSVVGAWGASAFGPLFVGVLGAVLWWQWEDR